MNSLIKKIIPFVILPIAVSSIRQYTELPLGNTLVWWVIQIAILLLFVWVAFFTFRVPTDKQLMRIVSIYLLWNVLSIVRGIFMAESYWHYKNLITMGMTLLFPLISYVSLSREITQNTLSVFVRYGLILAILFVPFIDSGTWGWYLYPVTFMMLLFPILPYRAKILIAFLTLVPVIADFNARSHVIKYSMPILLILFIYYSRFYKVSNRFLEISRKVLMIVPILFFGLAVSGVFHIFKMDEYIDEDLTTTTQNSEGELEQKNLKFDSRTFLYQEVISSAIKYNYWLIGRSPARGNETVWFAIEMEEMYGTPERPRNEVGILNAFTWTGLVGVVLMFLVFYRASYLAVNSSRNIYARLVGLYVAFHWVYSWVENCQLYDTNSFTIWMMMGLCFSSSFRKMNDLEVKLWAQGIFSKKYSLSKIKLISNYYPKLKLNPGNE